MLHRAVGRGKVGEVTYGACFGQRNFHRCIATVRGVVVLGVWVFGCWVLVLGARSWGAGELGVGWCGQYSSEVALLARASGQPWSWISVTGQGPAKCKNGGRVLHLCRAISSMPQCHNATNANDRVRQHTTMLSLMLQRIAWANACGQFRCHLPSAQIGHGQGMGSIGALRFRGGRGGEV
jgi:hypothetical protein